MDYFLKEDIWKNQERKKQISSVVCKYRDWICYHFCVWVFWKSFTSLVLAHTLLYKRTADNVHHLFLASLTITAASLSHSFDSSGVTGADTFPLYRFIRQYLPSEEKKIIGNSYLNTSLTIIWSAWKQFEIKTHEAYWVLRFSPIEYWIRIRFVRLHAFHFNYL